MAETGKQYKYVILRDRDGNQLLPYNGVMGLADLAFTGRYPDLLDKPEMEQSLPASKDPVTGIFEIPFPATFTEPVVLEYENQLIKDGDLAKDKYAVNEQYVYNVASYLIDSLKGEIDNISELANKEVEPDPKEKYTPRYCGSVKDYATLIPILGEEFDVYYVLNELQWYMYVRNEEDLKVWTNTYNGKAVRP